jgi:hypothetical protein
MINKATFNFPLLYHEIRESINRDKLKMNEKNPFSEKILTIDDMHFIELAKLWRELARHYRKISNEIPKRSEWKSTVLPVPNESGYIFSEDVPYFSISDEMEKYVWPFTRILLYCSTHINFITSINAKRIMQLKDICLGDKNCKEGIHNIREHLCISDFNTGTCDCMSKIDHDTIIHDLQNEIDQIKKDMTEGDSKQKNILRKILKRKEDEYYNTNRKIHYSDYHMKPFNQQLEEYIIFKETEKIRIDEETAKAEKVVSVWTNKVTDISEIKKVVKIKMPKKE